MTITEQSLEVTRSMLKKKWRGGEACFATLPRSVLWPPPIKHRHTPAERHYVSPFELSVLGALLIEARRSWYDGMYRQCMQAGAESIKQDKGEDGKFLGKWDVTNAARKAGESKAEAEAPTREFAFPVMVDLNGVGYKGGPIVDAMDSEDAYQPPKLGKAIKAAGQYGYHRKSVELEKQGPPKLINIALTRTKILTLAGLSTRGRNLRQVTQALERLTLPVADQAAPVASWTEESGQLRLKILGEWLKPPLPVPTRSPAATALYLMVWQLKTRQRTRYGFMLYTEFCAMLGIPLRHGKHVTHRALWKAVEISNDHLEKKLPRERLEQAGIEVPDVLEIKRVEPAHVRIHTTRADDDADSGSETGYQKRKRVEAEKKEQERIAYCREVAAAGKAASELKEKQEQERQAAKLKEEERAQAKLAEIKRLWKKDLLVHGDRVKPGKTFGSVDVATIKRLARDPKFDQDE
jgi:hypothetical protein